MRGGFRLSTGMHSPASTVRYALRQFAQAPIFTITAILTLALGIGGTTAIFTLMHAVMLRELPVADPASLYRVGDGDNCCVQGGPQKNWGMFSYALYQRLVEETPEFEQVTAFQAGSGRVSVYVLVSRLSRASHSSMTVTITAPPTSRST